MKHVDLNNLHTCTEQEVFDFIVTHIITQGRRATMSNRIVCAYRNESGDKCAAGCLIPDDMYRPSIEGSGWYTISKEYNKFSHLDLICELQAAHDGLSTSRASFVENFKFRAIQLAERRELNTNVIFHK